MAIYHLRFNSISRSENYHAVNSAAYRRGVEMISCEGEVFNWSKKKEEVLHSNVLIPENAPSWVQNLVLLEMKTPKQGSEKLWNLVEQTENRKDSQLFYEIECSLPKELDKLQQIKLVEQFITEQLTKRGMVVDYSIHYIDGNPHTHIACSTRAVTEDGFGKKVIDWKQKPFLYAIREGWANATNYALRQAGFDISISHKSYKERGIDLQATVHEGAARHIGVDGNLAFQHNDEVRKENFTKILNSPSIFIKKIALERETFTRSDLMAEFMRHAPTGKDFTPQIRSQLLNVLDSIAPNIGAMKDKLVIDLDVEKDDRLYDPKQTIQAIFDNLNKTKSVFTEYDLATAANVATSSAERFTSLFEQLKASNQLINLGPGDDGKIRFTTFEAFELENSIQMMAEELSNRNNHQLSNRLVKKYAKEYELNQEKTIALKHILTGSDLTAIVGYAGTGKSYLLGVANKAWLKAGFRVQGIALAGVAADGLEKTAGIPSRTIESFLLALKHGAIILSNKDIVVMDEAGMTDNHGFADVLGKVKEAGAKLVPVGDDAQLAPVGPGAAFRAIIERIGCAILGNVVRQKEAWQRQATMEFAKNDTGHALTRYGEKDYIKLLDTTAVAKEQLIEDWHTTVNTGIPLNECLILAFKNTDVDELNKLAREKLILNNKLSPDSISFTTIKGQQEFRIGERVLFLKNDRNIRVKNGSRGIVVGFEEDSLQVHLDNDKEKIIVIDHAQYNAVDYGYASTVHKAQGMTVQNSFVLAAGRWNKNLTYVAMSRHRKNATLYGSKDMFTSIDKLKQNMSRFEIKDITLDFPINFMLRRGVGVDNTATSFSAHWQKKLGEFFTIVEKYISPDTYYYKLSEEEKAKEIIERRKLAKIVGTGYIEARTKARDSWQAVEKVGVEIGIDKELNNIELFKALEGHPALEIYRQARDRRNEIAYNIWHNKAKLTKALELNAIDLEKIEQQALQHEYLKNVCSYLEYVTNGKVVWQDKLAYTIQNNIKVHYRALQELQVDTKLLRTHAANHELRVKLKELTPEIKTAIRLYNSYQHARNRAAEAWQIISSNNNSEQKTIRNMFLYANDLTAIRNRVAFNFVQNQHAEQVLELFGLKATTKPIEDLTEQEKWQQQKIERLYNYAKKHEAVQRIHDFLNQTRIYQEKIAGEICAEPKLHHGAICAVTADPQNLWQEIRQLAAFNKTHEFKMQLPWDQRVCFGEIEKYVAANRALGASLAELAETKKTITEIPAKVTAQIAEYGKTREAVAYKVNQDLVNYQSALEFFKISKEKISALALREEARLNVIAFKQTLGNIEHKAKLAQIIISDPHLYYGLAKESSIDFLKFYPYARYGEKLNKLAKLTPEEQADFRIADTYKQLFRQAGKYWTSIARNDDVVDWKAVRLGQSINAKRDSLAAIIFNNQDRFSEIQHLVSGNFSKLAEHAAAHVRRKDEVIYYLAQRNQLIEITEKIKAKDLKMPNSYKSAWQSNVKEGDKLNWQGEKYNAVFKELNISTNDFGWDEAVNELLPKVTTQYEKQKYYDLDSVNSMLAANVKDVAMQLLGTPTKRSNSQQLYFGSKKGSLCVTIQGNNAGLWHDFASGEGGNLINLVQREHGFNFKDAVTYCANMVGATKVDTIRPRKVQQKIITKEPVFTEEQLKKIALANKLAQKANPITNSCAEKYLASRGIKRVNSEDIKYGWAYEPEQKQHDRALCCFARDKKGEIQSVQVVYLDQEGRKIKGLKVDKRTYGPIYGASCLVNYSQNKETIYLAEGPETALSIAQAERNAPVYAVFGVQNLGKVPIPAETKKVVICADNDGKGASSYNDTLKAAEMLLQKGMDVSITQPRYTDQDFNDVLHYFGVNAVIDTMKNNTWEIKLGVDGNMLEIDKPKELSLTEEFIENRQEIERLVVKNTIPEIAKQLEFRRKLESNLACKIRNNSEQLSLIQEHGYSRELNIAYDEYQLSQSQKQGIHISRSR